MIETHDLSREYGPKVALSGLNLRVEPGEILGFLGPNGAGKSTTVKILTGMIRPTRGRARVAGFDVVEQPIDVKRRIGYVPETAALYDSLTASRIPRAHRLPAPSRSQDRVTHAATSCSSSSASAPKSISACASSRRACARRY